MREKERGREREREIVREKEREGERECVCVCVCVWVSEKERGRFHPMWLRLSHKVNYRVNVWISRGMVFEEGIHPDSWELFFEIINRSQRRRFSPLTGLSVGASLIVHSAVSMAWKVGISITTERFAEGYPQKQRPPPPPPPEAYRSKENVVLLLLVFCRL